MSQAQPDTNPGDASTRAALTAPLAPERPVVLRHHGRERLDEWHWLRDRDDPEVIAHLEAENRHTAAVTAHLAPRREQLYREIVGRIQETDLTVPTRRDGWWYYSRTVEGMQYPISCRKRADAGDGTSLDDRPADAATLGGDEVIVLDQNALAKGHDYFALGGFELSPDSRLLAYSTDIDGSELFTLRFKDLESGQDLPGTVEGTYYGLAWAADNATVFYTRPDESMRPYQLWRHRIGTDPSTDVLVMTEEDEHFFLSVDRTKDGVLLVCEMASKVTTEARILDAGDPGGDWRVVEPRHHGVEYGIDHQAGRLLIVTNDGAENFRLMEAPADDPGRRRWNELVPGRPDVKLDGVEVFADWVVLYERAGGLERLRVIPTPGGSGGGDSVAAAVELPEEVGSVWGAGNPEYADGVLRFGFTSLVTPSSVFDYEMSTGRRRLLKQQPVLGGYDPSRYRTERLWATARDGTKVPVSVVYPAGLARDGRAPCLLYGYGSYEHSIDPTFGVARLSLLERGFVFAIAHIRGGGEMGRRWYEDGKMLRKRNTFNDFVDVARMLVAEGWTSPGRLAARGGSAGGMLMGAVANQAPELFGAVVAEVPFVDCLTTILDETLPLTVLEWEEWGNPVEEPEVFDYMASYSPFDNVSEQAYPAILATAGLNDPRVSYWEPAKWVQRLRRRSTGAGPILLKTEMGAGHQGPSGRYDAWRDEAFVLAFLLDALGVD
ncbi:MAG: S9 family peptidase [Acidimicrobiales bacterium]